MLTNGKKINFKISRNGKFQMTGCKEDCHAENCVKYIWEYIKDDPEIYTKPENKPFKAIFIPAMRNIDFNLGFIINREKLDEYFNNNTEYYSLLETSIGYTGVNIKIPVKKPITDLKLKQLVYKEDNWSAPKMIPYQKYLDTLKPKEQQKKLDKERFTTFLLFHSGKAIISSMCAEFSKDVYYEFLDIIKNNYKQFEEKLEV
jgi:TATA-box binding protein (TBP) (component of TFIID and TFIIIB)